MTDVFISYARLDGKSVASRLEKLIEDELGLETFYDATDLRLGVQWMPEIEEAIQKCTVMIVVVSKAAYRSPYVPYEWGFALGLGKQLIPLIIHPEVLNSKEPSFFQKLVTFLRNGQPIQKPAIHEKLLTHQYWLFTDTDEKWPALKIRLKEIFEFEKIPEAVKISENDMLNNSSDSVREGAIKTLENNQYPAVREALRKGIKSSHPDVIMKASLAFARRTTKDLGKPDSAAIDGLRLCLNSNFNIPDSVEHLVAIDSVDAVKTIIDAYLETKTSQILKGLESRLGRITIPEILPLLRELWISEKRTMIMQDLARRNDIEFLPLLIAHLNSFQDDCSHIFRALGEYKNNPESIAAITSKTISIMNNGVRYAGDQQSLNTAIEVLQNITSAESLAFFVEMQSSPKYSRYFRNLDTAIRNLREKLK